MDRKEMRMSLKIVRESPSSGIWDGWVDTEVKSAQSYFKGMKGSKTRSEPTRIKEGVNMETNIGEKKLYFVENGKVWQLGNIERKNGVLLIPDTDGIDTLLVMASNSMDVLRVAHLHDLGQLQIDNHVYRGETIPCVSEED